MNNLAYKPQRQQEQKKQTQIKTKKVYTKITLGEKLLATILIVFLGFMSSKILTTQASVYEMNKEIVDLNTAITEQEKVNQELGEQVKDLSRYPRILKEAQNDGLKLNQWNVKVVD